jgi:hypothetical protein
MSGYYTYQLNDLGEQINVEYHETDLDSPHLTVKDRVLSQATLFDDSKTSVEPIAPVVLKGSTSERFRAFDKANPGVYRLIIKIALDLKAAGFKRAGMKLIFERIRWLYSIQTRGESYKLNNNDTAFYARKAMKEYRELDGFFETRNSAKG